MNFQRDRLVLSRSLILKRRYVSTAIGFVSSFRRLNSRFLHYIQVGIRKSVFTDNEKLVTETVIAKREQTAQEVAISQLENAENHDSNTQLNTGKYNTFLALQSPSPMLFNETIYVYIYICKSIIKDHTAFHARIHTTSIDRRQLSFDCCLCTKKKASTLSISFPQSFSRYLLSLT